MTVLVPIIYKGGVYRHDIIIDLIDDLGGYIVQKHMIAQEVVLQSLVPKDDIELIKKISRPLAGIVYEAPLVGTEIAVVSPSLEIHHLPHTSCDVAEYLRSAGAKTNMIGLARGFGKRIANLNIEERDIINEHDCAVFNINCPLCAGELPCPSFSLAGLPQKPCNGSLTPLLMVMSEESGESATG